MPPDTRRPRERGQDEDHPRPVMRPPVEGFGGSQGGFFNTPQQAGRGGVISGFRQGANDAPRTGVRPGQFVPSVPMHGTDTPRRVASFQEGMLGTDLFEFAGGASGAPITTEGAGLAQQYAADQAWRDERGYWNEMDQQFAEENPFYRNLRSILDEQISSARGETETRRAQLREQNAMQTRRGLERLRTDPNAGELQEEQYRGQMSMQGNLTDLEAWASGEERYQAALADASQKAGQAAQARDTNLSNRAQWQYTNQPGARPLDFLTTPPAKDAQSGVPGMTYSDDQGWVFGGQGDANFRVGDSPPLSPQDRDNLVNQVQGLEGFNPVEQDQFGAGIQNLPPDQQEAAIALANQLLARDPNMTMEMLMHLLYSGDQLIPQEGF